MGAVWSNDHIDCVINGSHRVVGLADVEQPYEFVSPGEMFELTRSRNDGGMYASANAGNILGGGFKLMLAFGSPTAAYLIERKMALKNAIRQALRIERFSMTFRDPVQGRASRMEGGLLQECPDQVVTGVDFEVLFEFQLMESMNGGALFEAPLETPAP